MHKIEDLVYLSYGEMLDGRNEYRLTTYDDYFAFCSILYSVRKNRIMKINLIKPFEEDYLNAERKFKDIINAKVL